MCWLCIYNLCEAFPCDLMNNTKQIKHIGVTQTVAVKSTNTALPRNTAGIILSCKENRFGAFHRFVMSFGFSCGGEGRSAVRHPLCSLGFETTTHRRVYTASTSQHIGNLEEGGCCWTYRRLTATQQAKGT